MKKFLACFAVIVTMFCINVSAELSPTGTVYHIVHLYDGSSPVEDYTFADGETFPFSANSKKKFNEYRITKTDGSNAFNNSDYTIISGSLTEKDICIEPHSDINVYAIYDESPPLKMGGFLARGSSDTSSEEETVKKPNATETRNNLLLVIILGLGVLAGYFIIGVFWERFDSNDT